MVSPVGSSTPTHTSLPTTPEEEEDAQLHEVEHKIGAAGDEDEKEGHAQVSLLVRVMVGKRRGGEIGWWEGGPRRQEVGPGRDELDARSLAS